MQSSGTINIASTSAINQCQRLRYVTRLPDCLVESPLTVPELLGIVYPNMHIHTSSLKGFDADLAVIAHAEHSSISASAVILPVMALRPPAVSWLNDMVIYAGDVVDHGVMRMMIGSIRALINICHDAALRTHPFPEVTVR